MVTRIPVLDIRPRIEGGRFPVKAVEGQSFEIRAKIFREGRDKFGAAAVLTDPEGHDRPRVNMHDRDNGFWTTEVTVDQIGAWTYRIETWSDPYATWLHDAPLKVEANVDVELSLEAGARLLERSGLDDPAVKREILLMRDREAPTLERLAAGMSIVPLLPTHPIRELVDNSKAYPLQVDRHRAMSGAWYEFFPRSEGAYRADDGSVFSGTFVTASIRLQEVAAMGFDVIHLPPIHPIGTANGKGPDNSLTSKSDRPGSPWAIGSTAGGHDTVNPDLGTFDDFDGFVATAGELGLEVALELALQCSPDHPWLDEHPEWFATRVDGSIAFAEDPPKKHEDIYPLNFDTDFGGLCEEIARIIRIWMSHGVRIFSVDNPHTSPLSAWQRILADIRATDPDVIFLSQAFTAPPMLHALAMVGFQQSQTDFMGNKTETAAGLKELASTSHFLRPNFFVNTPDTLPQNLHSGEPAMFRARAALAATGSPSWGMYAGYELCEHPAANEGAKDYQQSEKYEFKFRDWDRADSLAPYITALNDIRRRHPALQQLSDLHIHTSDDLDTLCFSKSAGNDRILVVIDLHPSRDKDVRVSVNLPALGLDWGTPISLTDALTGKDIDPESVPMSAEHPAVICTVG